MLVSVSDHIAAVGWIILVEGLFLTPSNDTEVFKKKFQQHCAPNAFMFA